MDQESPMLDIIYFLVR